MVNRNKNLGKDAERKVAEAFTKLFREAGFIGENESFYRVVTSGMLGHHRELLEKHALETVVGDIVCPTKFPFVIEVKRRMQPNFHLIVSGKHELVTSDDWIPQLTRDAYRINKHRLLVMFFPRNGMYVALDYPTYELIGGSTITPPNRLWFTYINEKLYKKGSMPELWNVISFADFSKLVMEDGYRFFFKSFVGDKYDVYWREKVISS